ncbi:MAG: hypothetical protein Q8781_02120 [Candidatus Phytoplasma stylosanthis]|uniref:hypothetical protein n=1 Tax=Candidatus Phytoplasma stylosanthis TaxID=2798314 RepID=UPI002939910C|nr:hypothetical protein [Candidatus Phytoplasma stylosanthis]MDV3171080.1 hypothetical protein [Candidatus Phytoplasma stylosanthis]MDV3202628.1 hypothetical protein [Candidatus Phytoplasma stylosanthis]
MAKKSWSNGKLPISTNLFRLSPQGGIISSLLVNIYLNQIDKKMEKRIEKRMPIKKHNPEYDKLYKKTEEQLKLTQILT